MYLETYCHCSGYYLFNLGQSLSKLTVVIMKILKRIYLDVTLATLFHIILHQTSCHFLISQNKVMICLKEICCLLWPQLYFQTDFLPVYFARGQSKFLSSSFFLPLTVSLQYSKLSNTRKTFGRKSEGSFFTHIKIPFGIKYQTILYCNIKQDKKQ